MDRTFEKKKNIYIFKLMHTHMRKDSSKVEALIVMINMGGIIIIYYYYYFNCFCKTAHFSQNVWYKIQ